MQYRLKANYDVKVVEVWVSYQCHWFTFLPTMRDVHSSLCLSAASIFFLLTALRMQNSDWLCSFNLFFRKKNKNIVLTRLTLKIIIVDRVFWIVNNFKGKKMHQDDEWIETKVIENKYFASMPQFES